MIEVERTFNSPIVCTLFGAVAGQYNSMIKLLATILVYDTRCIELEASTCS